jgi:hypothetical protein
MMMQLAHMMKKTRKIEYFSNKIKMFPPEMKNFNKGGDILIIIEK